MTLILLSSPPSGWDYRCVQSCVASSLLYYAGDETQDFITAGQACSPLSPTPRLMANSPHTLAFPSLNISRSALLADKGWFFVSETTRLRVVGRLTQDHTGARQGARTQAQTWKKVSPHPMSLPASWEGV